MWGKGHKCLQAYSFLKQVKGRKVKPNQTMPVLPVLGQGNMPALFTCLSCRLSGQCLGSVLLFLSVGGR